jgi:CheY-like chemotaxis protein
MVSDTTLPSTAPVTAVAVGGRRVGPGPLGTTSGTLSKVIGVLLATDSDAVYNEVDAALASDETTVWRVRSGATVLDVIKVKEPDLVLLDLQIGNMGGLATCLAIRQEEGFDRLMHRPVGLLLDRSADTFLANEVGAEGWIVKPLDALRLRRLAQRLLAGETFFEASAVA